MSAKRKPARGIQMPKPTPKIGQPVVWRQKKYPNITSCVAAMLAAGFHHSPAWCFRAVRSGKVGRRIGGAR